MYGTQYLDLSAQEMLAARTASLPVSAGKLL